MHKQKDLTTFIIPTYNYICYELVAGLQQQAEALKATQGGAYDYEIIVADDGSTEIETIEANRAINSLPQCRLEERPHNEGRARVRNWLIDAARFDHIVIIDSDAALCTPDFVKRYWEARDKADVVCGSLRTPAGPCPPGCELRYRYEKKAEADRAVRNFEETPYLRFTTFNTMVNRSRLGGLRFDKRCQEYGYEDALFGLMLRERGITLKHIDNPLVHTGIDTNEDFLKKTAQSMRTLHRLKGPMQEAAGASRLYNRLQKLRIDGPFRLSFKIVRPLIVRNLLGRSPLIPLLHLYKAGCYALYDKQTRMQEKKKK